MSIHDRDYYRDPLPEYDPEAKGEADPPTPLFPPRLESRPEVSGYEELAAQLRGALAGVIKDHPPKSIADLLSLAEAAATIQVFDQRGRHMDESEDQ